MEITAAMESDWPSLEPLLREMGGHGTLTADELQELFVGLVRRPDHLILAARTATGLAGYAWAQDYGRHLRSGRATVRLNDLFVRRSARRLGFGRALFAAVHLWARDRGASWMQWQGGTGAREFYERLGISPSPDDTDVHPFYELVLDAPE